jgi:hypothetical protein
LLSSESVSSSAISARISSSSDNLRRGGNCNGGLSLFRSVEEVENPRRLGLLLWLVRCGRVQPSSWRRRCRGCGARVASYLRPYTSISPCGFGAVVRSCPVEM